jgi:proteic killer suppression protein
LISTYGDNATRDVHHGDSTRDSRKVPQTVRKTAVRKLNMIASATKLGDLASPGNHLEPLKGNLEGWHSIKINDQWRIIFKFPDNAQAEEVTITDYH